CESLGGLAFCGWVNYWKQDDERVDGTIDGKDTLVVSRLMMKNSLLLNLGPMVQNEPIRNKPKSSSELDEAPKNQIDDERLDDKEWDGGEYVSSEDDLSDFLED
ncbi:12123_t:CDS:2, partial [Cetraspora pellucida]